MLSFSDVLLGDIVTFGTYEQDCDSANGQEPIEWFVIDKMDGKVLLVSRYALDQMAYDSKSGEATWETCDLRAWMNSDFINTAFTEAEKKYLCETQISTHSSEKWESEESDDTFDKAFILSAEEVEIYFPDYHDRGVMNTKYANKQHTNGQAWYWLRCNTIRGYARTVESSELLYNGEAKNEYASYDELISVRPAVWVYESETSSN